MLISLASEAGEKVQGNKTKQDWGGRGEGNSELRNNLQLIREGQLFGNSPGLKDSLISCIKYRRKQL